jgi:hypothetical protein
MNVVRQRQDPFDTFQRSVNPSTWKTHDAILEWALGRAENDVEEPRGLADDPLVAEGWSLKQRCQAEFKDRHRALGESLRVLVHVPDFLVSPGGYSLFSNLVDSLQFLGVPSAPLRWEDSTELAIRKFRPTCLLTSDHSSYLERIDWAMLRAWKDRSGMLIGLTASLEAYGNTPLEERLQWANQHSVDFYYSFRSPEYLKDRQEYERFRRAGYPIFTLEFGANPALYYPVGEERDLDYVFLASSNPDKHERYFRYLPEIFKRYHGFVDGPGWRRITRYAPARAHKYLYARAKVGLNLHIRDSIERPTELNERTYILAACGVPQLVDSAKLLPERFPAGALFIADGPAEYLELYQYMVSHTDEARERALIGLREVFARHTTYHKSNGFLQQLKSHFCLEQFKRK